MRETESMQVLVVDDDSGCNKLLQRMLKQLGYASSTAQNGREAIDVAIRKSFQLIFMDVKMPGMDGIEATLRLRQKEIATPIIALTAYAMPEDQDRCLAAGMDEVLLKPVGIEEIKSILERYCL